MIKKIFFSLMLLTFGVNAKTFTEALTNDVKKPIVVLITMNNCKYCKIQQNQINNSVIAGFLDQHFEFVSLNSSRVPLPSAVNTDAFPSIFIFDEEGNKLFEHAGVIKNKELLQELTKALNK